MAKINGVWYPDELVKKYTEQEFIGVLGARCGGCKGLKTVYAKLVKASGLTPKQQNTKVKRSKK